MLKKIVYLGLLLILLSIPLIRTTYYIVGQGETVKRVSILTIIIDDFRQGTVGTGLVIEN